MNAACLVCRKPIVQGATEPNWKFKKRKTCGAAYCRGRASTIARPPTPGAYVAWPQLTGELTANFAAHNLSFKPLPGGIARHEPERTLGGVSSAYMA